MDEDDKSRMSGKPNSGFSRPHLLHQMNTSLQIHPEVDEDPVDALLLVLFLLKHEHVMIEELLKLLIREVDTQLLEPVVLERDEKCVSGPESFQRVCGRLTCISRVSWPFLTGKTLSTNTRTLLLIKKNADNH